MEAYDNLSDEQKALVANQADIPTAEKTYNDLGNQQKVQAVKILIQAIGEVTYPRSKEAIESARAGYDELTDEQKPNVDNYGDLVAAEETYAELEAKAGKKLSGGAIAGIVIACLVCLGCAGFLVWFFLLRKKKEDKDEPEASSAEANEQAEPASEEADEQPKEDQTDESQE